MREYKTLSFNFLLSKSIKRIVTVCLRVLETTTESGVARASATRRFLMMLRIQLSILVCVSQTRARFRMGRVWDLRLALAILEALGRSLVREWPHGEFA